MEADNKLNHDELDFFIKGNIALEKGARKKPFTWLSDQGWEDIQKLTNVVPDQFSTLADDIERNEQIWKEVRGVLYLLQPPKTLIKKVFCTHNSSIK